MKMTPGLPLCRNNFSRDADVCYEIEINALWNITWCQEEQVSICYSRHGHISYIFLYVCTPGNSMFFVLSTSKRLSLSLLVEPKQTAPETWQLIMIQVLTGLTFSRPPQNGRTSPNKWVTSKNPLQPLSFSSPTSSLNEAIFLAHLVSYPRCLGFFCLGFFCNSLHHSFSLLFLFVLVKKALDVLNKHKIFWGLMWLL